MSNHASNWTAAEWAQCEEALATWQETCSTARATDPDPVDFRAGFRAALYRTDQCEED